MKLSMKQKIVLFLLTLFICSPCLSLAQYQYEITPSISLSELYDDNVNLTNQNEESEYITTASPGMNLSVSSELTDLSFQYAPTFVWYDKNDQNDTVRQSGTLAFTRELAQGLSFELNDTYLRSEDPLEETEGVIGVRASRNIYHRNTGRANFIYAFGTDNIFSYGYRHSFLENNDTALDDNKVKGPFANMSYWFNVKNGIELDFQHTVAKFSRDDGTAAGDNYRGYDTGVRYIYRFNPQTSGNMGYNFSNRHFIGVTEDYDVHEGSMGFDHSFSPDLSLRMNGGYFVQKNVLTEDEKGYSYNVSLNKNFDRGSFTVGGNGGWSENILEADRQGFTKYQGLEIGYQFQIMENLNSYAGGSYRRNKEPDNSEWKNIRVNYGLTWSFLRWYSLSMDYTCSVRDDDDNTQDYTDNRVMLIFSANRFFRK